MPTINPIKLESEQCMVLPADAFWPWPPPSQLNFQITFSGVAIIDFKGNNDGSWRNETLEISIALMRMDKIIERTKRVLPPLQQNESYEFVPLQWTTYASVNSQFDEGNSVNAGFGAYNFGLRKNADTLAGMFVDIQVRDRDARIHRVGYAMNVYGYFRKSGIIP